MVSIFYYFLFLLLCIGKILDFLNFFTFKWHRHTAWSTDRGQFTSVDLNQTQAVIFKILLVTVLRSYYYPQVRGQGVGAKCGALCSRSSLIIYIQRIRCELFPHQVFLSRFLPNHLFFNNLKFVCQHKCRVSTQPSRKSPSVSEFEISSFPVSLGVNHKL